MIKLVIWTNLNAQSVCTYQLWNFLILWCSTWIEDSRDYKFVIFGYLEQKIWIKQANRYVWFNLKIDSIWILKLRDIMALLESTCLKVSNGILFVIFGHRNQKLWIMQDSIEIWSEFLFWISFKPKVAMWHVLIGGYRFGWIRVLSRRIKRDLHGPDLTIPVG
jgi:hypothetical protein